MRDVAGIDVVVAVTRLDDHAVVGITTLVDVIINKARGGGFPAGSLGDSDLRGRDRGVSRNRILRNVVAGGNRAIGRRAAAGKVVVIGRGAADDRDLVSSTVVVAQAQVDGGENRGVEESEGNNVRAAIQARKQRVDRRGAKRGPVDDGVEVAAVGRDVEGVGVIIADDAQAVRARTAADHQILAVPAGPDEGIIASFAIQRIRTGTALDHVVAIATVDDIVAAATGQVVVALAAINCLVAAAAVDRVVARAAPDGNVVVRAARLDVGHVVAGSQVDVNGHRDRGIDEHVIVAATRIDMHRGDSVVLLLLAEELDFDDARRQLADEDLFIDFVLAVVAAGRGDVVGIRDSTVTHIDPELAAGELLAVANAGVVRSAGLPGDGGLDVTEIEAAADGDAEEEEVELDRDGRPQPAGAVLAAIPTDAHVDTETDANEPGGPADRTLDEFEALTLSLDAHIDGALDAEETLDADRDRAFELNVEIACGVSGTGEGNRADAEEVRIGIEGDLQDTRAGGVADIKSATNGNNAEEAQFEIGDGDPEVPGTDAVLGRPGGVQTELEIAFGGENTREAEARMKIEAENDAVLVNTREAVDG